MTSTQNSKRKNSRNRNKKYSNVGTKSVREKFVSSLASKISTKTFLSSSWPTLHVVSLAETLVAFRNLARSVQLRAKTSHSLVLQGRRVLRPPRRQLRTKAHHLHKNSSTATWPVQMKKTKKRKAALKKVRTVQTSS